MFDSIDQNSSTDTIANFLVAIIILVVIVGIPLGLATLMGAGQVDPAAAKILEDQGYTHVKITGGRWSGCGRSGLTITGFKADAPVTHNAITGQVCTTYAGTHYVEVD